MFENQELQLQWFVVQGRVRLAARKLHEAGYFAFVPEEVLRLGQGSQRRSIRVPLFGIYLFVKLDLRVHNWRCLLEVEGVGDVLCHGAGEAQCPVAMPGDFVDELVRRGPLDANQLRDMGLKARISKRVRPEIKPGDMVRFVDEVLGAQLVRVDGVDEKGRASVLMRIMGRLVPVRTSINLLEPASAAHSLGRFERNKTGTGL